MRDGGLLIRSPRIGAHGAPPGRVRCLRCAPRATPDRARPAAQLRIPQDECLSAQRRSAHREPIRVAESDDPRFELAFQAQLADYGQALRQEGGSVTSAWTPGGRRTI